MVKPASDIKNTTEYADFTNALRKVLSVSHAEMKQRLEAEKKARATTKKHRTFSARASADKD